MPYRKSAIVSGEVYHVFNRAVASVPIFSINTNFLRFLDLINYYRFRNTPISFSKLRNINSEDREKILSNLVKENDQQVEILAFCLMDNHFHFLLKQIADRGIAKFIGNLQNGYAKYFNIKYKRYGPLFQPMFKAVRITTEEQLLHVSRYVHLNPSTGYLIEIKDLEKYPWSSLSCYIKENLEYSFVSTEFILGLISKKKYRDFVYDQAEYQRKLADIKHLTFE